MKTVACAILVASLTSLVSVQQREATAVKPFKIVSNIYYVGTSDPTAYLITTPAGHILLDTTYESTAPLVMDSIRALGFKLEDVEIMISSHAHIDHVGGHAAVKRATGAEVAALAEDAVLLESGGAKAFHRIGSFAPVTVERKLKDGGTVELGGVTLTAHRTAGHTEGNTAWTMTVADGGRRLAVVFAPSMTINPGVRMANYPPWPKIADAYASSFALLKALKCDVFLAPHAGFFDLARKMSMSKPAGTDGSNPFVDPDGYRRYVEDMEKKYLEELRTKN